MKTLIPFLFVLTACGSECHDSKNSKLTDDEVLTLIRNPVTLKGSLESTHCEAVDVKDLNDIDWHCTSSAPGNENWSQDLNTNHVEWAPQENGSFTIVFFANNVPPETVVGDIYVEYFKDHCAE